MKNINDFLKESNEKLKVIRNDIKYFKKAKKHAKAATLYNKMKRDVEKKILKPGKYAISCVAHYYIHNYSVKTKSITYTETKKRICSTVSDKMMLKNITQDYLLTFAKLFIELKENYDDKFTIEKLTDIKITLIQRTNLVKRKMGLQDYVYKMLADVDQKVNVNYGECVIDYLFQELYNKPYYKFIKSRDTLIKYFGGVTVSVEQIIEFIKEYGHVSLHAINPMLEVFASYKPVDSLQYCLCFIVNNDHLYPIYDPDVKHSVGLSGRIKLDDYKFNVSYDDNEIQYMDIFNIQDIDQSKTIILINEDKNTMGDIMKKVMEDSKEIITSIKFNNSHPVAFRNPSNNKIFEVVTAYEERKQIVQYLSEQYGSHVVKFTNQSYTQISQIIFDNQFGSTKQLYSNLSNNVFDILDTNHINAFSATVNYDIKQDERAHGIDIVKSYSSVLLSNDTDYPVFQPFDSPIKFHESIQFVAGEYYISKNIILCDGLMQYPSGFYPLPFVKYCIEKKAIAKSDITMYIPAKQFLPANTFKAFVEFVYKTFSESDAKKIINFFIGSLGAKRTHIDKAGISQSWEIACSLYFQYRKGNTVNIDRIGESHFIRVRTEEKKYSNGLSIHRHIISSGIINLANMYYDLMKRPSIKVIAFNVDSIMYKDIDIKVEEIDFGFADDIFEIVDESEQLPNSNMIKANYTFSDEDYINTLGTYRVEDFKIKSKHIFKLEERDKLVYQPMKWNKTNEKKPSDFLNLIENGSSCLISGMAGSGKTELIKNIFNPEKDLVLSFTNNAVLNVKERCGGLESFYTCDSFFHEQLTFQQKIEKAAEYSRIIIDEYSMVPVKIMNLLNICKETNKTQLLMFGDHNQLLQVEPSGIVYDYLITDTFNKMCDSNLFICSYKENFSRYDLTLKNVLDIFVNSDGRPVPLPYELCKDKKRKNSYINICKSLYQKWIINQECAERYEEEFPNETYIEVEFIKKIKNKDEKIKINIGTEMNFMFGVNDKKIQIFNGSICKIIKIVENIITVWKIDTNDPARKKTVEFPIIDFVKKFEPAFAQTIYRYQGATIKEPYNVYELESMSRREIYTSLSRGTCLSNVNFNFTNKVFFNQDNSKPIEIKLIIDNEIDEKYKNSIIYKITFDKYIYIGQTHQTKEERFEQHKIARSNSKSNFVKTLKNYLNVAEINLVEKYPCKSLKEILEREKYYIEQFKELENQGGLELLNHCHNITKKVKDTEIEIVKVKVIEQIEEYQYHEHFSVVKNLRDHNLRFKGLINGKKTDISISLKKYNMDEAKIKLEEKINTLKNNVNIFLNN